MPEIRWSPPSQMTFYGAKALDTQAAAAFNNHEFLARAEALNGPAKRDPQLGYTQHTSHIQAVIACAAGAMRRGAKKRWDTADRRPRAH